MADTESCARSFSSWRYSHYFTFIEQKENNNISVKCNLCLGSKSLSTARNSNTNLLKHLQRIHPGTKLVASRPSADPDPPSDTEAGRPPPPKQQQLDFNRGTVSQGTVDRAIARHVVEDMKPISTVESTSFKHIVSLIPVAGGSRQMCRKTFSSYLEKQYTKMEKELKTTFEGLGYISTTADIWSAHNRSFLGVTAHWINPTTLLRHKAALACKRFKGRHTYDVIASEIDHIHSLYGLSTKVTSTVTDNGSNFVKAFAVYQPQPLSDDDDDDANDDEEVTFADVTDVLNTAAGDEEIVLPPHRRCASHTLNLISCNDVEKWLVSNPGTKAIYRSSTAKCTALWNKASRSTYAAEMVSDVVTKKLLVPCTTRWNSFYEAVARIVEIPMTDLSSISDKLQLKSPSDREVHFLKEYCATMGPLSEALDVLQGEDNCYFGTLLPTLQSLKSKLLEVKDSLTLATGLPDAIIQVRNVHIIYSNYPSSLYRKTAFNQCTPLTLFYYCTNGIILIVFLNAIYLKLLV